MPKSEGGFKYFRLDDLFEGQTGDVDLQQSDINGLGEYFINSGIQNCGIKGRTNRRAKVFEANTITIDFFGNAYYRSFRYKMATHNHVFSLRGDVLKNEKVGLYIVSQLSYLRNVFSYSNMGTWPKIKEQIVSLPIDKRGEINYHYMEAFIDNVYEKCDTKLNEFFDANGFSNCSLTDEERQALIVMKSGNVQMTDKTIKELFSVVKGKRLTKDNMIPGTTNFIGATATDNGITNRISNNKHIHSGNKITVTYNGSVGESFYQPFPFWASDDVNVLYPKENLSESQCLFFLAPLRKKGKRYGYAFKWAKEIMEQDSICVPIKSDGSIDYTFMETYVNALKKQCVARLKASDVFTNSKIETMQAELTNNVEDDSTILFDSSEVPDTDRFTRFLPLYDIAVACGALVDEGVQSLGKNNVDMEGWIDVSEHIRKPNDQMFVVRAKGESMLPKIHPGDLCVFEVYGGSGNAGSREGQIVLARQSRKDNDYNCQYTIKLYHSEKDPLTNLNTKIELRPLNKYGYDPLIINPENEGEIIVLGVLKDVINR